MKRLFSFLILTTLVVAYSAFSGQDFSVLDQPAKTGEIIANGKIRFEEVNADGDFTNHRVFSDPKSSSYKIGPSKANGLSRAEVISGVGRPENRVDVVMVGDGYTAGEMGQYAIDAANIANNFLTQEPLKTYVNYFKFHRVDVVSAESGVDHDPRDTLKNTALDMNFYCFGSDRLLCADMQKVKNHAANAGPADLILAMANSTKYGGAGYWNDGVATLSARNSNSINLALHEVGHTFAQLGDEYTTSGSSRSACMAKANASSVDENLIFERKIKWYRWLDQPDVAAFPGVCYASGGYRPTQSSKMRSLSKAFQEVNSEQFIFSIYKKVKPIDAATPMGTYKQGIVLGVIPMRPVGHNLTIEWFLNGKLLANQTGETLDTSKVKMTRATQSISVLVTDKTPMVRDEKQRALLLSDKRTWEIRKR